MDWSKIPETKKIIQKMCNFAEVDFSKVDFDNKEWYLTHTWTNDQFSEFYDWLVAVLSNNTKARNEIMFRPMKRKGAIKGCVAMFLLNYGWKTRD